MAKALLQVDVRKLQPFSPPGVWTRIDPEVRTAVHSLTEVDERIEGVERLSHQIRAEFENSDGDAKRSQIYFRAALSEFVSMEDAAAFDFKRLNLGDAPKIEKLSDPRLHGVRLLRHANVHLSATQLTTTERPAIWHGPTGSQEFQYLLFLATGLNKTIRATDQATRYASNVIAAMIDWLEAEQARWGIQHVVLRAAETYAQELATRL
jgi:hypothetical protein